MNHLRARHRPITTAALTLIALLVGGTLVQVPARDAEQRAYPACESRQLYKFSCRWEQIPSTTVRLFFPGQASWQWVTGRDHPGRASVLAGTACSTCHGNPVAGASSVAGWAGPPTDHRRSAGCPACHGVLAQRVAALGANLVAHPELERAPIAGKRASLDVEVQAAYDAEHIYVRASWPSPRPGIIHDLWRFDGAQWVKWGGPRPDAPKKGVMPSYEDRLAVMLSDRDLRAAPGLRPEVNQVGCWVKCHQDLRAMPKTPPKDVLEAHPALGKGGRKWEDIQKYTLATRTGASGEAWGDVRSADEIAELRRRGQFLDLWMWRAARGGPLGYADDFHVLDTRLGDGGKGAFMTPETPTYMYDARKVGFAAVPEERFEELLTRLPLIVGENAVPFDAAATFKKGDLLPRRVLRPAEGGRADVLANSWWRDGRWTVELRRRLDTAQPDDKALVPGRTYVIGLGVFESMVSNRRHHVSFPVTLGLGVPADIQAAPLRADGR